METIPIYIRKLKLKNIRSFGETCLDFEDKNGVLSQWTIIIGDNGIGKSTLLKSIAWMRPFLPYRKDEIPGDLEPAPIINDEENEVLRRLVRKVSKDYAKGAYIKALFQASRALGSKRESNIEKCYTSMDIKLDDKGDLDTVEPSLRPFGEAFYNNEVLMYAYSASRILQKGNLEGAELKDTIRGFIDDLSVLYDAQELFHTLNYATLGASKQEQNKYKKFLNNVKGMLVSLLPDIEKVSDIKITTPKLVNGKLQPAEFSITTKHGKEIPFEDFSLGYKTVLSWSIDLAWRLFNKYSESLNPLHEPAIVIIDEIDLHLHPLWQIEIIQNLSKHFPNVQFIATAHSPLMVQPFLNVNYAVLNYCDDNVKIINEPGDVDGWRVDQILASIYFGVDVIRGPEYKSLLERRNKLASLTKLTITQRNELIEITEKLTEFPDGGTSEEMADRQLIKRIIAQYKESGKKIRI